MLRQRSVLLLLVLALGGCTSKTPSDGALRLQLGAEPASLVPWHSEDGVSMKVLGNTTGLLLGTNAEGRLEPRLAQSWEWGSGFKTLTFVLRENLRWSDGLPVVAAQYADGIAYALDPARGVKMASLLGAIAHTEVVSPRKLRVHFKKPTPHGAQLFTLLQTAPLRKKLFESNGTYPVLAPTTGPYRIVSHKADQELRLERNPHYDLGRGPAPIEQVHFVQVHDESTAMRLFESGKLDVLGKIPSADYERMKRAGRAQVHPFLATYYLAFNLRRPVARDVALRRAVIAAIDREGLALALAGGETPAWGWIPPILGGVAQKPAGVMPTRRWEGLTLEAAYDGSSRNAQVLEKIQHDLRERLGIRLTLTSRDWRSHIRQLQTDPPALYRFGWLSPYADLLPHLQVFTSHSSNNYTGWKNAAYDREVEQVASLPPGPERMRHVERAEQILLHDEAIVIPIYHYVQTYAVSERVKGFAVDLFGIPRLAELQWK